MELLDVVVAQHVLGERLELDHLAVRVVLGVVDVGQDVAELAAVEVGLLAMALGLEQVVAEFDREQVHVLIRKLVHLITQELLVQA